MWYEAKMVANAGNGYSERMKVCIRQVASGYEVWTGRTRQMPITLTANEAAALVVTQRGTDGLMVASWDNDLLNATYPRHAVAA